MEVPHAVSRRKAKIIGEYKLSEGDTGSFEVQVAMLSKRISALTEHLQNSPQGLQFEAWPLQAWQGERRRLLNGLKRVDEDRYSSLIKRLGIRK